MKKSRTKGAAKPRTSRPRSQGTAVLGVVVPELTICGVFDMTDEELNYLCKGITTALLSRFHIDLLNASGLLIRGEE